MRKASAFTKVARLITVAAKEGGGDPAMNFSLRLALEKARAVNMPKENIERAIKKGTGELEGEMLEELLYEGFGPGGVGVLVEAVTDNKNRTLGDVKHAFAEHGGSLAGPGSVSWQFRRLGVVRISDLGLRRSDIELKLIDAGAEDIVESDNGVEIRCPIESLQKVSELLQSYGIALFESGIEWVPKETLQVSSGSESQIDALLSALEELDDVKEVYENTGD